MGITCCHEERCHQDRCHQDACLGGKPFKTQEVVNISSDHYSFRDDGEVLQSVEYSSEFCDPTGLVTRDAFLHVDLLHLSALAMLPYPWPRNQELPRSAVATPSEEDLVLAVSHTWSYQRHPDPLGTESALICDLAKQATAKHSPTAHTLVFCDFVSVSQQPFQEGQPERTEEQTQLFQAALRAMPQLYILADAVLHLEPQTCKTVPGDAELFSVECSRLDGLALSEMAGDVWISGWGDATRSSDFGLFDQILSVNGVIVNCIYDFEEARRSALQQKVTPIAQLKRSPFGETNSCPAGDRGWIYLERFCSMIKVAMLDESESDHVIFSNSAEVLAQIGEGGQKLKEAALAGKKALRAVFESFLEELNKKKFNGVSVDALARTSTGRGMNDDKDDRWTVAQIMKTLVAHLAEHWDASMVQQRQRQLTLAVNRGDASAVRELLRLGADPNIQDTHGNTCLHTAAKRGDRDVAVALLQYGARSEAQDRRGQTPAHLIPLWVEEETVELFDILATFDVLSLRGHAGISVFERFWTWSETACNGQPYDAIFSRLKDLADKHRELRPSRRGTKSGSGAGSEASRSVGGCRYYSIKAKTGVHIHVWEPKEMVVLDTCVVILSLPHSLPWSMQRSYLDSLAQVVIDEFDAKVFALTTGTPVLPECGLELSDFLQDILTLVDELPWKGNFFLVDNSFGAATSLVWPLQSRLSGALVVNVAGLFSDEYLDSIAHQKLTEAAAKMAESRRGPERNVALIGDILFSITVAGDAEFAEEVRHEWRKAAEEASEEFWKLSAAHCLWLPRARTELLTGLDPLQLQATVACSTLGPAAVLTESTLNFHRLLPNATFVHIHDSKAWWEVENPDLVISELIALIRRVKLGLSIEMAARI